SSLACALVSGLRVLLRSPLPVLGWDLGLGPSIDRWVGFDFPEGRELRQEQDKALLGLCPPHVPEARPSLHTAPSDPDGAQDTRAQAIVGPGPQFLDAEVTPLRNTDTQRVCPSPDSDPAADQLASRRQVVAAGSAPHAGFALFWTCGLRFLRKQTFTSVKKGG
ncbi:unnamed protein product, partial [Symbiodinium sp. CCMP2456]